MVENHDSLLLSKSCYVGKKTAILPFTQEMWQLTAHKIPYSPLTKEVLSKNGAIHFDGGRVSFKKLQLNTLICQTSSDIFVI